MFPPGPCFLFVPAASMIGTYKLTHTDTRSQFLYSDNHLLIKVLVLVLEGRASPAVTCVEYFVFQDRKSIRCFRIGPLSALRLDGCPGRACVCLDLPGILIIDALCRAVLGWFNQIPA